MADDRFGENLQLAVLAALCFDAGNGAAIAAQVRPDHFDGVWRDFVTRVLLYRKRYGKPPGEQHIEDIAKEATMGRKDPELLIKRLLPQLYAASDGLNAAYALSRAQDHIRRQVIKAALFEASDRFENDDEALVGDIEGILHKALRHRQQTLDAGVRLSDVKRSLRYLDRDDSFYPLGIRELDQVRVGMVPGQVLLYLAPKGTGKTWFCVHCGKQGVLLGLKVLHVSLEMDEIDIIPRYHQSLFGIAENADGFNRTTLEFDDLGRLSGFKTKPVRSRINFLQSNYRKVIRSKLTDFGIRFDNLIVKSFPTSSLTVDSFIGYLDYLEEVENFTPHILLLDYPKLMKIDRKNMRIDLGGKFEELRGVCIRRHMAGVFPHQGGRQTIGAKRVRSSDAGEDISVVQTADMTVSYSRTEEEERLGLGRLSLEHARRTRGGLNILLSQSYDTGQYVLESALMTQKYWERMKRVDDEEDE